MEPTPQAEQAPPPARPWYQHEDWLAVALGAVILLVLYLSAATLGTSEVFNAKKKVTVAQHPWDGIFQEPASWRQSVTDAFGKTVPKGLLGAYLVGLVGFGIGSRIMGVALTRFAIAYTGVFTLGIIAATLGKHEVIRYYSLATPLWAVLLGLLISNTVGTPSWLKPGLKTEFFIKTGLVIYGSEILIEKLFALGPAGICIAWIVTPIVLITTFWFGQRILRMSSPTLNITISADMSVCGVSAAIATAAACRAKREELTLAVSLSIFFTVIMMIVQPAIIRATGMNPLVGGAWIGGTIDATGAVAAAGKLLGNTDAGEIAIVVKMIQNILIGFIAFGVSVYWVTVMDRRADGIRPDITEVWRRFPKFILGFFTASLVFSYLIQQAATHSTAEATVSMVTPLREWFFTLTFVSIGLETDFRALFHQMRDGKALVLYVAGQALNLLLTLTMAWLVIEQFGLLQWSGAAS